MKRFLACICSIVLILELSACANQVMKEEKILVTPSPVATEDVLKLTESELKGEESTLTDIELNQEVNYYERRYELRQLVDKEYVAAVNDFSNQIASLLLADQNSNAMLSPISIQMALAMVGTGAEGKTSDELLALLNVEEQGKDYLSRQSSYLIELLTTKSELGGQLSIANSLWMQQNMAFEEDYTKRAQEDFHADLLQVDFTDNATARYMSQWISENTGGLLSPQIELSPESIMSIINTIYLKDEWSYRISEEETAPAQFYLSSGDQVTSDFMNFHRINYSYMETDALITTDIPLKDNGNMHFILPKEGVSVEDILKEPDKLAEVLHTYDRDMAEVILKLPKFSFGSKFELKDVLNSMGVHSAFKSNADFSGITKEGMAFISQITHQSHISIDEKGVEAAAYTDVALCGSSMNEDKRIIEINLNRPFIFAITDEDVILFIGVVNNPQQQ